MTRSYRYSKPTRCGPGRACGEHNNRLIALRGIGRTWRDNAILKHAFLPNIVPYDPGPPPSAPGRASCCPSLAGYSQAQRAHAPLTPTTLASVAT